jgi:hypothetical protein
MTGFLRNSDAFTWAMDSDPRLLSARMRRALLGSGPIPKQSQAHIDVGGGLAQRGGSTNHGTVRLRGPQSQRCVPHGFSSATEVADFVRAQQEVLIA